MFLLEKNNVTVKFYLTFYLKNPKLLARNYIIIYIGFQVTDMSDPPKSANYPPTVPQYGVQYQQPPPNYGQSQAAPQVTVVMNSQSQGVLGPNPCMYYCPNCKENVMTKCKVESSSMAWVVCLVLFATGFCFLIPWFICWIPLCMDSMRDTVHHCSKCNTKLGTYKC